MKDISENDIKNNIPLVSKKHGKHSSIVRLGDVEFGGKKIVIIAGPCAVESQEQVLDIAKNVKKSGARVLRGGAFKPLTFPYRNEKMNELREKGIEYLSNAGKKFGMPTVSEIMDPRHVDLFSDIDMLQIGARNMQNFSLLEEAAKSKKPILLKNHPGASLRDWLGAAEYFLYHGNKNVVLCQRGIVAPFTNNPNSRFIPDILSIIQLKKKFSHLPVIFDPSHSTFERMYVGDIAKAAIAAGADGIIIDIHPDPPNAMVDPLQALNYDSFNKLMKELRDVAKAVGRDL